MSQATEQMYSAALAVLEAMPDHAHFRGSAANALAMRLDELAALMQSMIYEMNLVDVFDGG